MAMSSLIAVALNTELTRIPSLFQNILGQQFNNSLCNGVTWSLFFWSLLHAGYSTGLNLLLKHWGFPGHLRIRLSNALWMLSFHASFLFLFILNSEAFLTFLFDFEKLKSSIVSPCETVTGHKIVGYALLCSFHIFSCYNQSIYWRSLVVFYKYLALSMVCIFAYSSSLLGVPFTLTAAVASSGVFEELCKLHYLLCNGQRGLSKTLLNSLFVSSLIAFGALHFLVIPLSFPVSVGAKLFFSQEPSNALLVLLFVSIIAWISLVTYQSSFLKFSLLWLNHRGMPEVRDDDSDGETVLKDAWNKGGSLGSFLECSLFPPRGDVAFNLRRMRSEVSIRHKEMIARRKPKNKNMIIQTLKCMMVIKRKLSQKKECMNTQDELLSIEQFEDDEERSQENAKCEEAASKGSPASAGPEGKPDERVADMKSVNLGGKLSSKFAEDVIDNIFIAGNQEGEGEGEEEIEDGRSTSEMEEELGISTDARPAPESGGKIQ